MHRSRRAPGAPTFCAALALALAGCRAQPASTPATAAAAAAAAVPACDPADPGVAGHPVHGAPSRSRAALACPECHAPLTTCVPAPAPKVRFGLLAAAGGAQPAYDPATRTCSGVYCHGATLDRPGASQQAWAFVPPDPTRPPEVACALCHGYPPANPHAASTGCATCHPDTVLPDGTIDLAGGRHVDGTLQATGCGGCHEAVPTSGAHLAHFALPDGSGYGDVSVLADRYPGVPPEAAPAVYGFGCGNCHPLDGTRHQDGTLDVELANPAAPARAPKARAAPGAAFDPASGTCSGVYCHSSGHAAPAYAGTPSWREPAPIGCAGCHGNPPRYPTGGAGTPTANSHLGLADDGWEYGHFLGLPGPFHTPYHGGFYYEGGDSAPITCQTCHAGTVDPLATGPSGFYWLDTTGDYALPGGDPYRVESGYQAAMQCTSCHDGVVAPAGVGRVLPLRHVNGIADVEFDARAALPAYAALPPAPNTPIRPQWLTDAQPSMGWGPGAVFTGTTVSFGLASARYDRATKTCSGVACHLSGQPVWGRPYRYYDWSETGTCNVCHPM